MAQSSKIELGCGDWRLQPPETPKVGTTPWLLALVTSTLNPDAYWSFLRTLEVEIVV